MNNTDKEYFRLLNTILEKGRLKKNRTGIDTIGVFGAQAKYDVNMDAFPILTTKKVWFKGIVHELLWFIKGDTNIKYLVDNDVHIWDDWAYKRYKDSPVCSEQDDMRMFWGHKGDVDEVPENQREPHKLLHGATCRKWTQTEFIKRIKTDNKFAARWGELGEGTYGGMWRDFPHFKQTYAGPKERCGVGDEFEREGVDQLKKVVEKLKSNPDDRRIIVSAWHPYWVDHCSLPPCHVLFQFNTEELTTDERNMIFFDRFNNTYYPSDIEMDGCGIPRRKLNCMLMQRSNDAALGTPFNLTSYCLLTAMIAHCVNMTQGTFTHSMGDLHIYENHIEGIKLQLTREPMKLPKLWLNPEVKSLFDFKYDDIKLTNYVSHPTIKFDVAI